MRKIKKSYIEITNICNLNCSFCMPSMRKKEFLSLSRFEEAAAKVSTITNHIYLHVLGEPLLHPEIGNILTICENYNLNVTITTNASMLADKANQLANKPALRQINYSLHSLLDENAPEGNTEKVIDDICSFIKATEGKILHCLRLWNLKSSDENNNINIIKLLCEKLNTNISTTNKLTTGSGIAIGNKIYMQQQQRFVWPQEGAKEVFTTGRCGGLRHDFAVLVDGTVVPCCLDADGKIPLGNIYTQSIDEIVNSPRAKRIKEGFACGKVTENFCRTCGFAASRFCNNEQGHFVK